MRKFEWQGQSVHKKYAQQNATNGQAHHNISSPHNVLSTQNRLKIAMVMIPKPGERIFAVIDTNVLVSALISNNPFSPTVRVLQAFDNSKFTLLYHEKIMEEYAEVLHRPKFHIDDERILTLLDTIYTNGINISPTHTDIVFTDPKDIIFYEVAMEKQDEGAWLVTGNIKHFPVEKFIVTPKEFMEIIDNHTRW